MVILVPKARRTTRQYGGVESNFFFQNGGRRACDQSSEMKVHLQTSNFSVAVKTIVLSENAVDSSQNEFLQVCVFEMSNILPLDR